MTAAGVTAKEKLLQKKCATSLMVARARNARSDYKPLVPSVLPLSQSNRTRSRPSVPSRLPTFPVPCDETSEEHGKERGTWNPIIPPFLAKNVFNSRVLVPLLTRVFFTLVFHMNKHVYS